MTKKDLRIMYKAKRLALSERDRVKLDDLLLIQFQKLSFTNVQVLLSYVPMLHTAEPETYLATRYLKHIIPGLQTAFPVADFANMSMQAIATDEDAGFAMNAFGIEEPAGNKKIDAQLVDMVFVPMLICDERGYRVGYGKGFYDRYFLQCRQDVIKVSFSYFEATEQIEDVSEYDVPLNYCITPHRIYEF